ncbi:MAG: TolC family protein [Pseudomonadota bacterium]
MNCRIFSLAIMLFGMVVASANAQDAASPESEAATPLTLDEVLSASARFFPAILEAEANRREALGEITVAAGGFDTLVQAESSSYASGFYDGQAAKGTITQPLRAFGTNIYGEYKVSEGDFPIYEDINFTNRGGTAKAGVILSLLRDRDIDDRRFAEVDAGLAVRDADLNLLLTQIEVQRDAAQAYWRWRAAGQTLAVYRDLLRNAQERDAALIREVSSGARAEIFLTENQQIITRRQSLVASSQARFMLAANQLSFYLRDDAGLPKLPTDDRLPGGMEALPGVVPRALDSAAEVLNARPELMRLENQIRRAGNRLQLRKNALKPRFDVSLELASGIGGVGEGGVSRDSTDTIFGLKFSVPIQRRQAQGRVDQARAELDALQLRRQQVEERIALELQGIVLGLTFAEQVADLAANDVVLSQKLELAEIERFRNGASDFFLVNLREQTVAQAQIREISARLDARVAEVNFDAGTLNLRNLALE